MKLVTFAIVALLAMFQSSRLAYSDTIDDVRAAFKRAPRKAALADEHLP